MAHSGIPHDFCRCLFLRCLMELFQPLLRNALRGAVAKVSVEATTGSPIDKEDCHHWNTIWSPNTDDNRPR